MSWRHGLAAGELDLKDPTAKAVLNALAFHANDWTGQAWPDLDRLMLWTGLSKRAVQMGLRRLENFKLVKTHPSKGRGWANVYELTLAGVRPMQQGKKRAPDAHSGAAAAQKDAADASQSSGRIKEGKTLKDGWTPSNETVAWATKEWPDVDLAFEVGRFITVNLSKGETFTNVEQAFRAWILRGKQLTANEKRRRDAAKPAPSALRSLAMGGRAGGADQRPADTGGHAVQGAGSVR